MQNHGLDTVCGVLCIVVSIAGLKKNSLSLCSLLVEGDSITLPP